jgi:hypothetical protein
MAEMDSRITKGHLIKYAAGPSSEVSGIPATISGHANTNREPLEARDPNLLEARLFSPELYDDQDFNEDLDYQPLLDLGDQRTQLPGTGIPAADTHFETFQPPGVRVPGDQDQGQHGQILHRSRHAPKCANVSLPDVQVLRSLSRSSGSSDSGLMQ